MQSVEAAQEQDTRDSEKGNERSECKSLSAPNETPTLMELWNQMAVRFITTRADAFGHIFVVV